MSITAITPGGGLGPPKTQEPAEQVRQDRLPVQDLPDPEKAEKKVNSEELFDRIKELSQDGQYSVRFEMNEDVNALVIRVVDRQTGEVIRQIPNEELLKSIKALQDLRGLMVDMES
ncbi:flagellar protein FlaG [Geothermobacter ehrlichii]|uniref:Flagellar protein FlaG n=1 Tax=Geothermobacter ehrlichii TaxID=213224 RepID=A0A5D3WMF0_9BACT|nr:flagellar protein FlaG [Geothermobacter ehrlichii]TYP00173.1 flagellar protein FlaG [Geothermobacter ehrlichii]